MKNKNAPPGRWENPRAIRNAGAERITQSLLLGSGLRRKASAGLALGTFLIELPTPATLTCLSLAGFDFVILDMEHSSTDFSTLASLISAAHAVGIAALVRTCGEDSGLVGKILDMGAHGIVVPHVDSPARARQIVEQARFPPRGKRGFSPLTRFDALLQPLQALDDSTYVVVQIEGRAALEQVSEIAVTPGIDAVFVGPYDLALSLGVPPGSPQVFAAARSIAKRVPPEVALGIYLDDPARSSAWAARRFTLQCVSFDGRMLSDAARTVVQRALR
ncbi:MAG TPA: aldolase/citrate lyase family protein, partial [Steroidobacteraceae bacterium]|nr:aldolase/citrate lyase family protein [Steroidobacteraceae bacterium]